MCHSTLEYKVVENVKKCWPVKSWTDSNKACAYFSKVVNLLGTDCVDGCAATMEIIDTGKNQCVCGAHAELKEGASACACIHETFHGISGACACNTGLTMTPIADKCIDKLMYASLNTITN